MKSFLWSPAGATVRYHDLAGRGPALVLIHGLGASAAQAYVDACRLDPLRDRRCVIPDLLGHGHSDRPETFSYSMEDLAAAVAGLLDDLRLRDVVLVGHSMGGAVAIVLAEARPDLVACLVLAEAHLDPAPGSISGLIVAHSETDFARRGHAELVRTLVAQGHNTYAGSVQAADPVALHRSAMSLIAPRRPTFREVLVHLTIPRTFLVGRKSGLDEDAAWLAARGVSVRVIPGAAHDLMNDQPDAFAAELGRACPLAPGR